MERIEHDVTALGSAIYPLLNACVVPRPIAWVSTRSAAGVDNLAPHSYFTIASITPPTVCFTSVGVKDTVRNLRDTGEFTVSIITRALADTGNVTGTDYPPHTSEYDASGLTREPSRHVAPPRVAESPVALECRVTGEHVIGSSVVVFGEVVHVAVGVSVADGDGRPDLALLQPVSRLGANDWGTIGEVFALRRIPFAEVQG